MNEVKVPAADQTLRIMRLLATARGPLPASMIAAQLELPRSTVYHLLSTMQGHGFVMHLPEEQRYGLGIAALELGSAYSRQEPLTRIGRPLVAALVERTRANGHLAAPHGRDIVYLIEQRLSGGPALVSDVDVRLPMHLTASGRSILAALPKAQVRALYPDRDAFVHRHEIEGDARIDRYSKLRAVLDETQTRGYGVERGAVTQGISSVAVPVLDHRSWPVAAVALTYRDEDVAAGEEARLVTELRATAELLSARIHGRAG
ncbi:IclR family transcriptional regulator [Leucobacter chromiireducens]|uniref:IclR family transcriptional regulator n=1 Tax=Leucobacter chromiireducens subsp. solipictus TaxID=398235 RepID=A0ABS1SCE4_9MICO|nr:IclR family transcriptional regulator [Leucobacter chromiireducens]MBL3678223.1 IclR family transcriptional regulator [Leucobacter chromiireducens subsp. solipictus]